MNASINIPINIIDNFNLDDVDFFDAKKELNLAEAEAYGLFRMAVDDIKVIRKEYVITVASSFGKDSTVTVLAALQAHVELIQQGDIPQQSPFIITSIDTGVENHLMTMMVHHEVARLRQFGVANNLNIDIRIGTPNLSRLWSSMFLSGLKILSLAQMNNDCSEELKIRTAEKIERSLAEEYNGNIVTLLGSRISESASRKKSLVSRGQHNKTPEELIEFADGNRKDRVFAPIVNMTDEHVWLLLRRAGNNPITQPSDGFAPIPSYCSNHRLLNVVYGDATDGSCPVSSKKIKGDKKAAGGCGKSARTGCFTCLKPIHDQSATIQAKSKRHGVISQNMLDVRNYMMFIGNDISYRTWHTRAIDFTTNAIACQPNVLSAETLDYLIKLMCQVTVDEIVRAKAFSEKVRVGDEILDEGYADIFSDNSLTDEDKDLFASVYKEFAVNPLITPMTRDIAVYLSAIHSRDGVKLPPYRALYHWVTLVERFMSDVEEARYDFPAHDLTKAYQQVRMDYEAKGLRVPYPKVDPSKGVKSQIPDAVMITPDFGIDQYTYIPHTGGVDLESAEGCLVDSHLPTTKIPYKYAKRMLSEAELLSLGEKSNADMVTMQGFDNNFTFISPFLDEPKDKKVTHKFSKRGIKKVSRVKGGYRVVERGRTSLDKPSFGSRTSAISLSDQLTKTIPYFTPSLNKEYDPFMNVDEDTANAYEINEEALMAWEDYDGLAHAMQAHDDAVKGNIKWQKHIYFYGSAKPFESLMRWNVLDLNNAARRNTMMILKRTSYFATLGLFRLDDKRFVDFVTQRIDTPSFQMSAFVDTKHSIAIQAHQILPMPEYRSHKARHLLSIREDRNKARKALKESHKQFLESPFDFSLAQIETAFTSEIEYLDQMGYELAEAMFINEHNLLDRFGNSKALSSTFQAYLRYMFSYVNNIDYFYELMPKSVVTQIKVDITLRKKSNALLERLNHMFVTKLYKSIDKFIEFKEDGIRSLELYNDTNALWNSAEVLEEFKNNFTKIKSESVGFELSDSPAAATFDIEW
jgi:3'-phosphoadenosine 5'-phosphosulfate sulfotransferase (PAPS reductase)/FAD synthetase